ncbi:T9SS type A sorting domain-containing protein [uncultured Chryseobacterium sp.]|uniref:T9SS type A sorting domain-containing protein n=1 Tax=uncultured Chryseobacterium sp. TaxID=259322 RepID=UPI0025EAE8B9|nr:T9SS type A sorting domain-containing protein [uncultured Chryseobacterium sp.]
MKKIYISLLASASFCCHAQNTLNAQLQEINYGASSTPSKLTRFNNKIIFTANRNNTEGTEPWVYDPATQKSTLLKDIFPGFDGGIGPLPSFRNVNNKIYFLARQNYSSLQIWQTDGTPAGTVKAKDLPVNYVNELVVSGNKLYFYQNQELWTFDTVTHDLILLKTFFYSGNVKLYAFNNQIFLAANDGVSGKEIWKTDGTVAGTEMLKDISTDGGSISNDFKILTLNNGKFYFMANTATGFHLYASDGTAAGTVPIKPMPSIGELDGASNGDYFVFTGYDDNGGYEPWVSDGTTAGTKILKDIYPGIGSSNPVSNVKYITFKNAIYFDAISSGTPVYGNYIWKTDGTENGTELFTTPNNNILHSATSDGQYLILNKTNYYQTNRFWIANGNPAQTFELTGVNVSSSDSFVDMNSKIYLAGSTPKHGRELFSVAPASQQVALESDISKSESSAPHSYAVLNDDLVFIASDMEFNNQIYKRNKNTQQVSRVTSFPEALSPNFEDFFFKVGNWLYTVNNTANQTNMICRTDGTAANSFIIQGIGSTSNTSSFINLNDMSLLFTDITGAGTQLWKINNNSDSKTLVKSIDQGNVAGMSGADNKSTVVNGLAYFAARENGKLAIWKSDGTGANTTKAIQMNFQNGADGNIKVVGNFNNRLLYSTTKEGYSNTGNTELFVSDGDAASSVLLKSHSDQYASSNINRETETVNGKFIYSVSGYPGGLYSTDGTAAGTQQLSQASFSGEEKFKKCGHLLFYAHTNGTQLWRTDGSSTGTFSLASSLDGVKDMTCVNNYLYFLNGNSGKVWKTNGNTGNMNALNIFVTNDDNQLQPNENILKMDTDHEKLFLTIATKEHGSELYITTDTLPVYLAADELFEGEKPGDTGIRVFPNPVTGHFSFKLEDQENAEDARLFDTSGKLVKILEYKNSGSDISDVPTGIYFLKVKTRKREYIRKIIKK